MSGGHATASGIGFQSEVGAWLAAHVLTEKPVLELGNAIPLSVWMETTTPVDDIVVQASDGGRWFINVKTSVGISTRAQSPLGSVGDQFVRQWLAGVIDANSSRSFDSRRDRLVLVTQPAGSRSFVNTAGAVIRRIVENANPSESASPAYSGDEAEAYKALLAQLRFHLERHTGSVPNELALNELISSIRLLEFDFNGSTAAAINTMLSSIVDDADLTRAVPTLIAGCLDFSRRRSGGNRKTLRDMLRSNLRLKEPPAYQANFDRLQESTRDALVDMNRYSTISVAGTDRRIRLQRTCSRVVQDAATQGHSCLVIGEPGSGKSGALHAAAERLLGMGRVVLLVQVDQLVGTSLSDLQYEFGLSYPLIDTLAEWRPAEGPILMIDALDASRGTGSEPAVRTLIGEIFKRAPHWTVIASIRKFDLRYGSQYHRLFEGRPISEQFSDPDFRSICHVNVPKLTPEEVLEVRSQWPALDRISELSSAQFNTLLTTPFNLFLLGRILNSHATAASPAKTQLDLLELFWKQRVTKGEFDRVEEVIQAMDGLLRKMLQSRRLTAANTDIPSNLLPAIGRLLHDGVLYQPQSTRSLSFAHHMLFDYALASLVFLRDEESLIHEDQIEATKDVLLVAPAIVLALRMVWDRHTTRAQFWNASLSLAADERLGRFIQSLPARVAVEAATVPADMGYLLNAVRKRSEPALLLAKHIMSAVLAGVVQGVPRLGQSADPWCEIVELLSVAALEELQWPLNAALGAWADAELTDAQRRSLGNAARRMLNLQLTKETAYHAGTVSAAIQAVLATYSTAPKESEALIRSLIDESRVPQRGHTELFWLANGFKSLVNSNPELAADFLAKAFLAPLPSKDEKTSLGNSRILSLTSNKRQDFEGILYQLQQHLPWFFERNPEVAGRALRTLISGRIASERGEAEPSSIGRAELGGNELEFFADHSCIWWSPNSGHYDVNAQLIEALYDRLKTESIAGFLALERVILAGRVPAALVAVFLRAAVNREDPGDTLRLLLNRDVLRMLDTSYDAAELARRHYTLFSSEQRAQYQDVVASIDDVQRQSILIKGLPAGEPLLNDSLRRLRGTADAAEAENRPHFSISSSWGDSDGNAWLRHGGVETDDPANAALLVSVEKLKTGDLPADTTAALELLVPVWRHGLDVVAAVDSGGQAHALVKDKVLEAVADLAVTVCERAGSLQDLARFDGLRKVIERCLADALSPLPVADDNREASFAESPSWGRPAPRIPAAEALMCFIRAAERATEADVRLVLKLARDPAVAVRHTILARANVCCKAAPDLSKQLAEIAFREEKNAGVLSFFLVAFDHFMVQHLDWAPEALLALDSKLHDQGHSRRGDLRSVLVRMILRLWVAWDVRAAEERLMTWADAPLSYRRQVEELLSCLRQLVVYSDPDATSASDDKVRSKSTHLFSTVVRNLSSAHRLLHERANEGEDVRLDLTHTTQLLDSAAHHLYFGSGAYALSQDSTRSADTAGAPTRLRFISEYLPTLRLLAQVPYPSVTHPILQIIEAFAQDAPEEMLQLFFDAIRGGGQSGGYQFESLGAELVVTIARRFLADHSGLLLSKSDYRSGLVEVLDLFAGTGWPEPRKLVYQLPEMLR